MTTATSDRIDSRGELPPLQLPLPGLYADLEAGTGSIAMINEFLESPAPVRISLLQQWTRALSILRDTAFVEMFREYSGSMRNQSIVEQIDRFRQHCAHQGLNCPSDFAVLLQRF